MTPEIIDWLARRRPEFAPSAPDRVIEVGSRDVNGSPRGAFADALWYCGVDLEAGPGVDVTADGERLASLFAPASFAHVICCETLEHCVRPWLVVEAMKAVLRPGGLLWVTVPTFGFPEHKFPVDCYRFGEDALRLWLYAGMELLAIDRVTDSVGNFGLAALGRKM